MRVYFVRHAESVGNQEGVHQISSTKLTEIGRTQAQQLAQKFSDTKIDLILVSPMERTRSTAEEINKLLKKPVLYSDLLIAIRRPSQFLGRKIGDPEVLRIKKIIEQNYRQSHYRFSDEETFDELKARGEKVIKLILEQNTENVLVVAHGAITRMVVGLILLGDSLINQQFLKLSDSLFTGNATITVCDYDPKNGWKLITWNGETVSVVQSAGS